MNTFKFYMQKGGVQNFLLCFFFAKIGPSVPNMVTKVFSLLLCCYEAFLIT